jgi:hypothetical protein
MAAVNSALVVMVLVSAMAVPTDINAANPKAKVVTFFIVV